MSTQETTPVAVASQAAPGSTQAQARSIHWWQSRTQRKNLLLALVFIGPWLIGLLAFTVYPIFYTVRLSFTRYGGLGTPTPVGWANYERMLHDQLFRTSVWNTLYFTGLAVPIGVVVAMILALAMNQPLPEIPIYRTILYLPSV